VIVGVGFRPGTGSAAILAAVRCVLDGQEATAVATVRQRAVEPGLVEAAAVLGVPILSFRAADLAEVAVPNPSARVAAAVGTASVAEAAALATGGRLVAAKQTVAGVTVAVGCPAAR
jgi:cobalt-precorrin 5A hydrolase